MKIPEFHGLTDATTKVIDGHNRQVDEVQHRVANGEQQLSDLSRQVSEPWPKLARRRDELRAEVFSARQEQLAAVLRADELLRGLTAEMQELRETHVKTQVKVVARVEKDLRKAGLAPEQNPVWAVNPDTAVARFNHSVALSEDVRKAQGDVDQCEQDLQTVDRLRREAGQQSAAMGEQLRKLAANWLGI
ncbi:MAG: hypothetical protein ACKOEO_27205 [Planctomycetaceae bacterium]